MAAEFFKEWPIDIHVGGIDLRFPHHDNEIAQSEAYYECDNWIQYFLHTGHLHIEGKKMSKSLKNFISIGHILTEYTSRQIRFLFLLHNWDKLMNYKTEKSMPEAVEKERQFSEFFKNVKAVLRGCDIKTTAQKFTDRDNALQASLSLCQRLVHERLADNFDTPAAVQALSDLVTQTNAYLQIESSLIKLTLVRSVSKYVHKILKCFGVYDEEIVPASGAQDEASGVSQEELITPFMNALSKFRDQVKERGGEGAGALFKLCDELRDDVLP